LATRELGTDFDSYTSAYTELDNTLGEPNADLPYARLLAKKLGLKLREITIAPDVAELLPKLLFHLDEPLVDPAAVTSYLMSSAARQDGNKVLLSGHGADEMFLGGSYLTLRKTSWVDSLPTVLRGLAGRLEDQLPGLLAPEGQSVPRRARRFLQIVASDPSARYLSYCTFSRGANLAALFSADARQALGSAKYNDDCLAHMESRALEGFNRYRDRNLSIYTPNHNLAYADKMAMAVGLEVRVPYLDIEVVKQACSYPYELLIQGHTPKWILREAARGVLPDEIIDRPKAGLGAPYRKWLRYDMEDLWHDATSREAIANRGWFDYDTVQRVRKMSLSGYADLYMMQWAIITIELWARQFIDRKWAV
jgi:asparagine synthase (glutamine-hydrolysing)